MAVAGINNFSGFSDMDLFTPKNFAQWLASGLIGWMVALTMNGLLAQQIPWSAVRNAPVSAEVTVDPDETTVEPDETTVEPDETTVEPDETTSERPMFEEGVETGSGLVTEARIARGSNGELAYLKITILDKEHYWPLGRADVIMTPGGQEERIFEFLDSAGLQKKIEQALDIISIGMASCEMERTHDSVREENRAKARADQLINWTRRTGSLRTNTQLFTVNLGWFKDPDCRRKSDYETRLQRNAILISVTYKENISSPGDLERLLRAELVERNRLDLEVQKYSLAKEFELQAHS